MPLYIGGASIFVERRYLETGNWKLCPAWRTRIMRVSLGSVSYVLCAALLRYSAIAPAASGAGRC